jgi:hypothetical protein
LGDRHPIITARWWTFGGDTSPFLDEQRREFPRAVFNGRVTCIFADIEGQPCEGRNISEGGALLHVPWSPLPPIGTLVELRLESKATGPLPVIDAEVVRVEGEDLFAVRFINLDPARRAIIRRIVDTAGEPPPEEADSSAGSYSLRGQRTRAPTQVFEEEQLTDLVKASKTPTGEEPAVPATGRRSRSSGAGYPNIGDAVRAASTQFAAIGDDQFEMDGRLPDLTKVPVVRLGVGAIPWENVNPLVAVVLAKVDGRRTYAQVIDSVEEVSHQQAAELLGDLLEHRIIETRHKG